MPCFSPLPAWQTDGGEIVFAERGKIRRELSLPCGQCIGCRLERSRQWAIRCMHESYLHEYNSFVTLTYDDDHLPYDGGLCYPHFQRFMKRLRRRGFSVRFFMCGEYGDQFLRPHYHACLFNCFFPDRVIYSSLASGSDLYTSDVLSDLWPYGFASVGDVTFESAAYVARYCVKKVTGRDADVHYQRVDSVTGEVYHVSPEFCHMSLKPGIGRDWYNKYRSDVFPRNEIILRGVRMKPPRYYDRLLKAEDNIDSDVMEYERYLRAVESAVDSVPERLQAREVVTRARLSFKVRTLK